LKKTKILLLLLLLSGLSIEVKAQTSESVINTVNELTNNGKFEEAQIILERCHRQNPKDFKITVLCGQIAYVNKKYDVFINMYTEAMELKPNNFSIKLEYAKMLFDINEWETAYPILIEYLKYNPDNIDALMDKAKIDKNNEDYYAAYSSLSTLLTKDPTNAEARDLQYEVNLLKSKWAKLSANYATNSQPFDMIMPVLEGGIYFGPLTSPKVKLSPILFQRNQGSNINVYRAQVENRSFFKDLGIGMDAGIGLIMFPGTEFDATAKIKFDKYAERYILLSLGGERKPFFGSLYSIDSTIMVHTAFSSLELITKESWNGKGVFETTFFDGIENPITTVSAYLMAPRLKWKDFDFKAGYGINFSTSKVDKFYSDKTDAQIIGSGNSIPIFTGNYYPYYTPKNQLVNSFLFALGFVPSKETKITLNASYGFLGEAEKPYFFRETNIVGDVYVSKSYQSVKFHPSEVSFMLSSYITPKIEANINFDYSENFFYITRALALGIKVNFSK